MKALSLFSGIGGIDLAAEWAGIETVAFCEYADFPRKILEKHWPDTPIFKDVKELNKEMLESERIDIGTIDIIHGGFPCQPYSNAGKLRGTEDDRDLWPEMFRIIAELRPRWIVGENVANFAHMELDRTLLDLENVGYQARTFVLPASAVGACHQRSRTFIVANSDSERRDSFQIHREKGCDRISDQGYDREAWYKASTESSNLLSSGARLLSSESSGGNRNDDGISEGVDRLKALGNAVVPQQVYPIFQAIMEIEGNLL